MINLKASIIGVVIQLVLLVALISGETAMALRLGNFLADGYTLGLDIIFAVAVMVSSFISARIAWKKAYIYGSIMAVFGFLIRLIICLITGASITLLSALLKFALMYAFGFVSAALGVSIKSEAKF